MCTVRKTVHRLFCCIQYYLYKLSGKRLSGKCLLRETICLRNICPGKWLSGKRALPLFNNQIESEAEYVVILCYVKPSFGSFEGRWDCLFCVFLMTHANVHHEAKWTKYITSTMTSSILTINSIDELWNNGICWTELVALPVNLSDPKVFCSICWCSTYDWNGPRSIYNSQNFHANALLKLIFVAKITLN